MIVRNLPVIKQFVETIERNVNQFGFQKGIYKSFIDYGTALVIKGLNKETAVILKNKAVVMVSNHPHEVDTLALIATLPVRSDTYFIINAIFMGIWKNIDKYLIPVYIHHHSQYPYIKNLVGRLVKKFHPMTIYPSHIEHAKNMQSISYASEKIKKGGLVIIFPGRRGLSGKWFSGVGHLLKGAKENREIYVVKAHIQGTSKLDYFRIIPILRKFLPKIVLHYSQPMLVNHFLSSHPKAITQRLEEDYNQWQSSLKKVS